MSDFPELPGNFWGTRPRVSTEPESRYSQILLGVRSKGHRLCVLRKEYRAQADCPNFVRSTEYGVKSSGSSLLPGTPCSSLRPTAHAPYRYTRRCLGPTDINSDDDAVSTAGCRVRGHALCESNYFRQLPLPKVSNGGRASRGVCARPEDVRYIFADCAMAAPRTSPCLHPSFSRICATPDPQDSGCLRL